MKARVILAAAVAAMVVTSTARADGFGVAAKAGTLGYGAELGYRFNDYLGVRVGLNAGSYEFDQEDAGVNYKYKIDFDTVPALVDWYVFGGTFRLTGGFVSNKNKMAGTATGSVDIGGVTYPNTTATADVAFEKSSTYVGLGWGGVPSASKGFGLAFDLGAVLHGTPTAKLSATSTVPIDPADLAREEQELNDELKDLKYWPVVSLTIGYTF
jgi:hypothetical protein